MKSAFSKIAKTVGKDAEEDQEDEAENWRDYRATRLNLNYM